MPNVNFKTTKIAERAKTDPLLYEILRDIGLAGNDLSVAHDSLLARVAIIEALLAQYNGTAGTIAKWTTSTTLGNSVITESGSTVGVNSSATSGVVNVLTTGVQPVYGEAVGTTVSPFVLLQRARGTPASKTAVQVNDYIGGFQAQGHDGAAYVAATGAAVAAIATETWTNTVNGCDVLFIGTNKGTKTEGVGFRVGGNFVQVCEGGKMFSGTGSPEGVVTAGVGSLFLRTDGGAGTSLYVKETGSGNTGWVGK